MNTSKPIATISYNTEAFLSNKLFELRKHGVIDYAMWIKHEADTDDTKAHFHVYIEPSKMIQTNNLVDMFNEIDLLHSDGKPLGVKVFRSSKDTDWTLYALHDEEYLTDKGLSRNLHYQVSDIKSTCEYTLNDIVAGAYDQLKNKLEKRLLDAVFVKNMNWNEIVRTGMIPIPRMSGALIMYKALTDQQKDIT